MVSSAVFAKLSKLDTPGSIQTNFSSTRGPPGRITFLFLLRITQPLSPSPRVETQLLRGLQNPTPPFQPRHRAPASPSLPSMSNSFLQHLTKIYRACHLSTWNCSELQRQQEEDKKGLEMKQGLYGNTKRTPRSWGKSGCSIWTPTGTDSGAPGRPGPGEESCFQGGCGETEGLPPAPQVLGLSLESHPRVLCL